MPECLKDHRGPTWVRLFLAVLTGSGCCPALTAEPHAAVPIPDDRNPAWLMAGREIVTLEGRKIEWSQPEILLYHDDPFIRMSYPDLVEDGGKFFVTETQKSVGRVHELPSPLLEGLFNQFENRRVTRN